MACRVLASLEIQSMENEMSEWGWFTMGIAVGIVVATIFIVVMEILYQTFSEQITAWLEKYGTPPGDAE